MGQNESTWTASELVYLFVDGEADDVQKTQLFGALANNSDLQAELADAIRINAAVRDETANAAPPAGVTAALFERAGIGTVASSSSAPVVSSVVVGGTTAGVGLFIKRLGLPLVTGFLGAVLALIFVPELGLLQGNRELVVAEQPRIGSAQVESSPLNNSLQSLSATNSRGEREERVMQRQQILGGHQRSGRVLSEASLPLAAQSNLDKLDNNIDGVNSTIVSDGGGVSELPSTLLRPELSEVPLRQAFSSASLISSSDREVMSRVPRLTETNLSGSRFHFSTQLRGILGLETFPNRSLENGKSAPLENLALTAFWHPSEHHAFGIEVGRERHPLYVQNDPTGNGGVIFLEINGAGGGTPDITIAGDPNDPISLGTDQKNVNPTNFSNPESTSATASDTVNGYRLEPIVEWVGLAYQFKAGAIDSRGAIRPYVQTVVGATQSGPIGKATLGVAWKPEDRISLGVGVEGTSLFYRRDGEWFSSRKVGATYSVQVEF